MRRCGACGKPIESERFIQLTARLLLSDGGEYQDELRQAIGDYCRACLQSGAATKDALKGIGGIPK